MSGVLVHLDNI